MPDEAVAFIRENHEQPFFLYLAHAMPHTELWPRAELEGESEYGLYGDCIEEIDEGVGSILAVLEELEIDDETLVIFTSDNGPWLEARHQARGPRYQGGRADPLRGAKMMTWEGGVRVPCVMRWPGTIPEGRTSDEITSTIDLLPTLAGLVSAQLADDRTIDGVNLAGFLTGETETSPRDMFYYYCYTHLQAVRCGKWKLVLPRQSSPPWTSWYGRMTSEVPEAELYDLEADMTEEHDVAAEHPQIVAELMAEVEKARHDLGDYNQIGAGARFFDEGPRRGESQRWLDGQ